MKSKKLIIAIAGAAVLAVLLFTALRRKSAQAKAAAGAAGEAAAQRVTAFVVERSSFTDAIDGLIGTVKGDTIELTAGRTEEPVTAIHVQVGKRVKKGELLFELDHVRAAARKDQAEIAYERARELQTAGAATARDVQEARSAFDIAKRDHQDTYLRAPKNGYVSEIAKQVGETVNSNEPIGVLVSSQDSLFFETGVIESQLDRVSEGQTAWVEVEAFGPPALKGKVSGVSREVTTTGRTGTVFIALPAAIQARLRPGLSARCKLVTFEGNVPLIPRQAYDKEKGGVFVIQDGKAHFRAVELGYLAPDYYEVRGGLAPSEVVVRDLLINPVENEAAVIVDGEPERFAPPESQ